MLKEPYIHVGKVVDPRNQTTSAGLPIFVREAGVYLTNTDKLTSPTTNIDIHVIIMSTVAVDNRTIPKHIKPSQHHITHRKYVTLDIESKQLCDKNGPVEIANPQIVDDICQLLSENLG